MAKDYNPLAPPAFSRSKCEEFFSSKPGASRKAAELHKLNPNLYKAIRQCAQQDHNLLDGPSYYVAPVATEQGTDVRLENSKIEFPLAECQRLFQSKTPGVDTAARMAKEDPARYQRARSAAQSFGVLPSEGQAAFRDNRFKGRAARQDDVAKNAPDGKMLLDPALSSELGLSASTRVSPAELTKILTEVLPNARASRERFQARKAAEAEAQAEREAAAKLEIGEI
jgi:hypothetical protein